MIIEDDTLVSCSTIEETRIYFEELVQTIEHSSLMEEIDVLIDPYQSILVPCLEAFKDYENQIKHILQRAIDNGAMRLGTYSQLYKAFKNYLENEDPTELSLTEILSYLEPETSEALYIMENGPSPLVICDSDESLSDPEFPELEPNQYHRVITPSSSLTDIPHANEGEVTWLTESMKQINPSKWHSD